MKYEIVLNSREFELVAEEFDFDRYYQGLYDDETKLGLDREAWQDGIPLYLHDVGIFDPQYLAEKSKGIVTSAPIFEIFGRQHLTFSEMLDVIYARRNEIVKITPGDENPYE